MKSFLYDFVLAFTIKKEINNLKFFKEISQNLINKKYCVIFFFDKSRDISTYNFFLELCKNKKNYFVFYDPLAKNLADAYYRTYLKASQFNSKWVISMNGGFRHNPNDLKLFIRSLNRSTQCIWGYRKQTQNKAPFIRKFISRMGNVCSRVLLQINIPDLTSGFYAIKSEILKEKLKKINHFLCKFHFIDTELKYYLKNKNSIFIPIGYKTYNKKLSIKTILDSLKVLLLLSIKNFKKL